RHPPDLPPFPTRRSSDLKQRHHSRWLTPAPSPQLLYPSAHHELDKQRPCRPSKSARLVGSAQGSVRHGAHAEDQCVPKQFLIHRWATEARGTFLLLPAGQPSPNSAALFSPAPNPAFWTPLAKESVQ